MGSNEGEITSSSSNGKNNQDEVTFGRAAAEEIAKFLPERIGIYVKKSGPYIDAVGHLLNLWFPVVVSLWNNSIVLWRSIEKYHPEEYLSMAFGLVLAFFGGNFVALIAGIEAFKMCGWETTKRCVLALYGDYKIVKEVSDKDDLVDDNHDGIADVLQINKRELATRKIKLVIKSCNPDVISEAIFGFNTAMLASIASLRAEFAFTITLGATIGSIVAKIVHTITLPFLKQAIPIEYQKWISPLIRYSCRGFGITIAWWLQTLTSSVHSALRGGEQFTKGLIMFLARNNYTVTIIDGSYLYAAITYFVALTGFYWQISTGYSLIFPLNFLLFPFTMLEWLVRYIIAI